MASANTESSPLLPQQQPPRPQTAPQPPPRPQRTVTFNPLTTISTPGGAAAPGPSLRPLQTSSSALATGQNAPTGQPMLSALNSKLRRRNSHGAPLSAPATLAPAPKIGPQRTTKNAQKLKLLPNPETAEDAADEESGRDVYSQFTRIKDPTARRDAARLGKADRDRLPRVTAYCTANAYRLEGVLRFLKSRGRTRGASPKLFDECIYSPYNYDYLKKGDKNADHGSSEDRAEEEREREQATTAPPPPPMRERRYSDSAVEVEDNTKHRREDLIDLHDDPTTTDPLSNGSQTRHSRSDSDNLDTHDPMTQVHKPEIFLFNYGTVVIWGMTPSQENRFLSDISKFSLEKLSSEDTQVENFNFYYTRDYQARIYNDFISLRPPNDPRTYSPMTKLAISHALSQSVKTSLFEDLVSTTITATSPLPAIIAQTGSINLTRRQINMQIGELVILRINLHVPGSVLDSPELMWAEPQLEPVYSAVRSYLEMDQRVGLLTERLDVIADLLAVLKDQLSHRHGEYLEWIVIILIAAEILVAAINIVVDLYAGVD